MAKRKKVTTPEGSSIERSSVGLREALFEEFDNIRLGISTPQRATAVSKLASNIISSAKLDLEYKRFIGEAASKKALNADPLKALSASD